MCMKYVNVTAQCFDAPNNNVLRPTGFSSIIKSIEAKKKYGKYVIDGFYIITFISVRGTKTKSNSDNPLDMKKKLNFKIRLTKLDEDENRQLSYDLKDFTVDLADQSIVRHACFDYVEKIEVTDINNVPLEECGSYVIKILVKEENADLFDIQSLHYFYVT